MICKICLKQVKNFNGLATHIRYSHKDFNVKKYYDLYLKKENEEKCNGPECNNFNRFISVKNGYTKNCCQRCKMFNPIIVEKIKKTLLKNYGVEHPLQSETIFEKMITNNIKKYGKKHQLQRKEIIDKIKNICLDK